MMILPEIAAIYVYQTVEEGEMYAQDEHDRVSQAVRALLDYALPKTYHCLSKPELWSELLNPVFPNPDLVIVRSEHKRRPERSKAVVIVEIMTKETAELDCTLKLLIYTNLSLLRAYVLVSISRKLIVLHHRLTSRAEWNTFVLKEYDEVFLLEVGIFASVRLFYENFDERKPPELRRKVVSRPRRKPVAVR